MTKERAVQILVNAVTLAAYAGAFAGKPDAWASIEEAKRVLTATEKATAAEKEAANGVG